MSEVNPSNAKKDAPPSEPRKPTVTSLKHKGWVFESTTNHISTSEALDAMSESTGIPTLPEMVYGENCLQASHESGFSVKFIAEEALKLCLKKPDEKDSSSDVLVTAAQKWTDRMKNHPDAITIEFNFDWTYTTDYAGTVEGDSSTTTTTENIDIEKLKRPDPILFYQDVILFEDELHDNGVALLSAKIRVMPERFLILLRYWLRVDGVMIRVIDSRLYHEFGTDYLIRDTTHREATYAELKELRMPTDDKSYTDPNRVAHRIPMKSHSVEKISFGTGS